MVLKFLLKMLNYPVAKMRLMILLFHQFNNFALLKHKPAYYNLLEVFFQYKNS